MKSYIPQRGASAIPLLRQRDRLVEPAGQLERLRAVRVRAADLLDGAQLGRDHARLLGMLERVAGRAAERRERVVDVRLDEAVADVARERERLLAADARLSERPFSISACASPATTRARSGVGGRGGTSRTASR